MHRWIRAYLTERWVKYFAKSWCWYQQENTHNGWGRATPCWLHMKKVILAASRTRGSNERTWELVWYGDNDVVTMREGAEKSNTNKFCTLHSTYMLFKSNLTNISSLQKCQFLGVFTLSNFVLGFQVCRDCRGRVCPLTSRSLVFDLQWTANLQSTKRGGGSKAHKILGGKLRSVFVDMLVSETKNFSGNFWKTFSNNFATKKCRNFGFVAFWLQHSLFFLALRILDNTES